MGKNCIPRVPNSYGNFGISDSNHVPISVGNTQGATFVDEDLVETNVTKVLYTIVR